MIARIPQRLIQRLRVTDPDAFGTRKVCMTGAGIRAILVQPGTSPTGRRSFATLSDPAQVSFYRNELPACIHRRAPTSDIHGAARRRESSSGLRGHWGMAKLISRGCRGSNKPAAEALLRLLEARTSAANLIRRGAIALNSGRFDEAANCFLQAGEADATDVRIAALLASAHVGAGQPEHAVGVLEMAKELDGGSTSRIRHALVLQECGRREDAIASLRESIRANAECPELHFQLGVILASIEDYEEAELRFTQALSIQPEHCEAAISLALCHGARGNTAEAFRCLHRLQARYPRNARVGLLLTQAAKAVHQQGLAPRVSVRIVPPDATVDEQSIGELSHLIEADPDFVDAFLSISESNVDSSVFTILLRTLECALNRQPEHAELHFHCGQVLRRLGRPEEAIAESERAVGINPSYTRALIELARLYQQTDRRGDAVSRLQQAIEAGAAYADVYCLLGDLRRDAGEWGLARDAYGLALRINTRYQRARDALAALPA